MEEFQSRPRIKHHGPECREEGKGPRKSHFWDLNCGSWGFSWGWGFRSFSGDFSSFLWLLSECGWYVRRHTQADCYFNVRGFLLFWGGLFVRGWGRGVLKGPSFLPTPLKTVSYGRTTHHPSNLPCCHAVPTKPPKPPCHRATPPCYAAMSSLPPWVVRVLVERVFEG